ncbi:MAG: helix-turn-helix domain-containing protein [Holosporaceae bacterium]|jgi:DNA-binding transcriptional regulator YiaG|nr:helix-turn-helix domain-containing protein [Holosporaceae bacterium]
MKAEKANLSDFDQPIIYTAAQLKGRRLRMVRALAGLSRQELYEKIGIATSTIDTWESGRVELTEKSAHRMSLALRNVGVYCSGEWLLTGSDTPPRMMDDVEKLVFLSNTAEITNGNPTAEDHSNRLPPFLDEDVRRELSFFVNLHKNAMFHILETDLKNSCYKRSDCVAGIVENPIKLTNKTVIVQLCSGKITICKSINGDDNNRFFCMSESKKKLEIAKAAEIIWHRITKKR